MKDIDIEAIPYIPENYTIRMCEVIFAANSHSKCQKAKRLIHAKGVLETRTNCFMFNSIWKRPQTEVQMMPSIAVINLMLLTNVTDYFPSVPDRFVGMYIEFHSPMGISNPLRQGFEMYPGGMYKFIIKERVMNLLPAPYPTNCTDYLTEWKSKGNSGPISQAECIEYCKLQLIREERGCVDFFNYYPHAEPLCDSGCTDILCSNGYNDYNNISLRLKEFETRCSVNCRPGCKHRVYEVKKDNIQVPEEVFSDIPNRRDWKRHIYIRITFDEYDVTSYTYSPKFEVIEIFSYLGGYVGIWLGISLIAICDFIESIVVVIMHPVRRFKRKLEARMNPTDSEKHSWHYY